ncbi:MAG: hypothetical protein SWH54_18155 [Thermodesulfobacteriota bacterium]|nr:hypothetical protein [Thermodesulfobacteriota bacterium]
MKKIFSKIINNYSGCTVIRKDEEKVILKVPNEISGGNDLFVKIYLFPNKWKRFYNFAGLKKGGFRDYRVSRKLISHGVDVPDPVGAYNDMGIAGFPRRSLFASKWIKDAISVRDLMVRYVAGKSNTGDQILRRKKEKGLYDGENKDLCGPLSRGDLKKLSNSLGEFIAFLQKKRIYCNDLNAGNFLVRISDHSRFHFLLIDYEGISFIRPISRRRRIFNLSQIAAFMSVVDDNASHNLCQGYVKIQRQVDLKKLTCEVKEKSKKLEENWKKKLDDKFDKISRELLKRKKTENKHDTP